MLKHTQAWLAALVLLMTAGCAGSAGELGSSDGAQLQLPAPLSGGRLPAPSELPRTVSSALELKGAQVIGYANGMAGFDDLSMTLTYPPEPKPGEVQYAFAIYRAGPFTVMPNVIALSNTTLHKAPYWVGMADFQKNVWDWSLESHKGSYSFAPADALSDLDRFLDADGYLNLVVLLADDAESVKINTLTFTSLGEVTGLTASSNRWDGIKLSWDVDADADGTRVFRRAPVQSLEWEELTVTPLEKYTDNYLDQTAADGISYQYLVQMGMRIQVQGVLTWFWSDGMNADGYRLGSILDDTAAGVTRQWPVNLRNYLSFFFLPEDAAAPLEAIRSQTYPPKQAWEDYPPGQNNFGPSSLEPTLDTGNAPFGLIQASATNNPLITTGFSTSSGVFAQVAQIEVNGTVAFEQPVNIRPGETGIHFIAYTQIPRHLMALMWNSNDSRLEMMETFDEVGREWYSFDPEVAPWQIANSIKPSGRVDMRNMGFPIYVSYRSDATGKAVVTYLNNGWHDESPNLNIGPGPQMAALLIDQFVPGKGMIYITEDGTALKVVRQSSISGWQLMESEQTTIAVATDGQPITQFDTYSNGDVSYDNYVSFIQGGQLYMAHCADAGFENWTDPILVDPAVDCRDLHVLLVGTDAEFTNYVFATYIKDDEDGVARLNFRDLKLALAEYQAGN